jgi:hemin uptake protein HemP
MDPRVTTEPEATEHGENTNPAVSSSDLFRGKRQLVIEHGRDRYRLLLTKSNKLILIK